VVRRTFWLIKVVLTWKKFEKRCSKAKLKNNGDRAFPCLKPFLIGNTSDKFLTTRTLLYVSVRHIFISLTSFLGIPNSMRIWGGPMLLGVWFQFPDSYTQWSGFVLQNCFFCFRFVFVLSCVYFAGVRLSAQLSIYIHSLATDQRFKIPVIGFPTFFGSQSFPLQGLL
jgi:hypothetical protein